MPTTHQIPKASDGQVLLPGSIVQQLLGVTVQTMNRWDHEENPPTKTKDGKYPARDLGEWIRKQQTLKFGRGKSRPYLPAGVVVSEPTVGLPSAKKDYNAERTRKEAAQADKIEMENAVAMGELVRAEDVEKGWSNILSRVKTRMMRVPFIAAQVVVGDDDLTSVQSKIADFIRDALNELSADWRDADDEDDD